MTVCNMAIEGGARAGLIAPDEKTFAYVKGRPHAPKGAQWEAALSLVEDALHRRGRAFRQGGDADAARTSPRSSPGAPAPRTCCRSPASCPRPPTSPAARSRRRSAALDYMGLTPGHEADRHRDRHRLHRLLHQRPDRGSARGRRDPEGPQGQGRACARWSCRARAWCAPRPRKRASRRSSSRPASTGGWPAARCASAMNPDQLAPGERCASTSNRNFEGRQGRGGRTHLLSPGDGGGGGDHRAPDGRAGADVTAKGGRPPAGPPLARRPFSPPCGWLRRRRGGAATARTPQAPGTRAPSPCPVRES